MKKSASRFYSTSERRYFVEPVAQYPAIFSYALTKDSPSCRIFEKTKNDRDQNKKQLTCMRNSELPNFSPKASQAANPL